jgi:hypothetical protein
MADQEKWIGEYNGQKFIGDTEQSIIRQIFEYCRTLPQRPDSKVNIYKEGTDPLAPRYGFY